MLHAQRFTTALLFILMVLPPGPRAMAASDSPHGYATPVPAEREIRLEKGKAQDVNVKRFETIRFTYGEATLTWTFDTLGTGSFPLSKVVPGAAGTVYVEESPLYSF
jgi:hypothetical protein